MKKLLVLLLAFSMALSVCMVGCGKESYKGVDDDVTDSFHKYSQTLNMKVGQWVADEKQFPVGESPSDNLMYDLVEEYTNIHLEPAFTTAYGQYFFDKVAMLQVSDKLPDVTAMDASCFADAVEAGQLADLTEAYEKLASPTLKRIIESNNGLYKNLGTVDGKLYAIPEPKSDIEGIPVLWIRKDWVEICGWKNSEGGLEPQTYEEFESLLYAFKQNKSKIESETGVQGVYPMAIYKEFAGASPYRGVMNAHGAYPGIYLENEDGTLRYGSLDDEMKDGLTTLNKYAVDGILRSDWATQDTASIAAEGGQGKYGVFIDAYWAPLATQVQGVIGLKEGGSNPGLSNADWIACPMPGYGGEAVSPINDAAPERYYVVNVNYPNPEAMIILMNYLIEGANLESSEEEQTGYYHPYTVAYRELSESEKYASRMIYNWLPIILDDPTKNETMATKITAALGDESKVADLVGGERYYYDLIIKEPQSQTDRLNSWVWKMIYGPDGGVLACKEYESTVVNAYMDAPTESMVMFNNILNQQIENVAFTRIICEYDVSQIDQAFAKFKEDWLKNGGEKILGEING